jgi:aminoglycoside phosphotransferase (APT) family kinase protein
VTANPYGIVGTPLSGRPWAPEVEVSPALGTALIESQFPALAPATLELMGEGWDNTAYLVNGEWVFRFPRRTIAVPLLDTEGRVLPALAPRLPFPIPVPEWFGRPDATYKWPFLGYRRLAGHVASDRELDAAARTALAEPLARFLRALHDVPMAEAEACGVPPDRIGYLDPGRLDRIARPALADLAARGLIDNPSPWLGVLERGIAALPLTTPMTIVHGDFYSRHILVDDDGRMTGVIDFGDMHLDHPALDVAVAWTVLPPAARRHFFAVYGDVDDRTRDVARLRALASGLAQEAYGRDVGDAQIEREGLLSLRALVA